jgi:pimeloyl-ACP methyl ester carboxylesterase
MSNTPHIPLTSHHRIEADGLQVFYREAGPADAPVVLLLHGFPASSFQYRELIPRLADRYRVIAPDLPGFGFTEVPAERNYTYTFDALEDDLRLHQRSAAHALRSLRLRLWLPPGNDGAGAHHSYRLVERKRL